MRRLTLAAFIALAFAGPAQANCQEDSPCWNWVTMGNHRRAVVTIHGTRLVVGQCAFKRLTNGGMLRYRPRDVMRGDFTAMRLRCR